MKREDAFKKMRDNRERMARRERWAIIHAAEQQIDASRRTQMHSIAASVDQHAKNVRAYLMVFGAWPR